MKRSFRKSPKRSNFQQRSLKKRKSFRSTRDVRRFRAATTTEIAAECSALITNISQLSQQLQDEVTRLRQQTSEQNARIATLTTEIQECQRRLLDSSLTSYEEKAALEQRISDSTNELDTTRAQLTLLEEQLRRFQADLAPTSTAPGRSATLTPFNRPLFPQAAASSSQD